VRHNQVLQAMRGIAALVVVYGHAAGLMLLKHPRLIAFRISDIGPSGLSIHRRAEL
jgi:hypothetical protein